MVLLAMQIVVLIAKGDKEALTTPCLVNFLCIRCVYTTMRHAGNNVSHKSTELISGYSRYPAKPMRSSCITCTGF